MKKRVLILSECTKQLMDMLASLNWEITLEPQPEKARRLMATRSFSLLVAELSLKETPLQKTILELSALHAVNALVLCPHERMDMLNYQYQSAPILVLPVQTSSSILNQILLYMVKNGYVQSNLLEEVEKQKRRLKEEKEVFQTKIQLVTLLKWSEERAHQYILKTAMDHSITKAAAARQISRKLERILHENQKNKCDASA